MTAYPYTATTGAYTIEQLEGEACAELGCGEWFQVGEATVPTGVVVNGAQLFRHAVCPPKGGATR